MSPLTNEDHEREHFYRIISAFKCYRQHSLDRLAKTERYLDSLPEHHRKFLHKYKGHLKAFRSCIENNHELISLIIKDVTSMFENSDMPYSDHNSPWSHSRPAIIDLEKVHTTLKQLVRDWSEEGAKERQACYQPILDEIASYFPPDKCVLQDIKILVPGAGLGRLAFEIARRGYTCQGNEFSLFMLFASNFVLNRCNGTNLHRVHPWIHQYENNISAEHQMESVTFPDTNPAELSVMKTQFTMIAGDFLEVYSEADEWDCIATCFFIDCGNNIVAFIDTIYKILKPGGIWINLGPLLYHFSNICDEDSIEPSYDVVKEVIKGFDFIFEKEDTCVKTTYSQNPHSMLQYAYNSVFFVCRKPHSSKNGLPNCVSNCVADGEISSRYGKKQQAE